MFKEKEKIILNNDKVNLINIVETVEQLNTIQIKRYRLIKAQNNFLPMKKAGPESKSILYCR